MGRPFRQTMMTGRNKLRITTARKAAKLQVEQAHKLGQMQARHSTFIQLESGLKLAEKHILPQMMDGNLLHLR